MDFMALKTESEKFFIPAIKDLPFNFIRDENGLISSFKATHRSLQNKDSVLIDYFDKIK